jgi:putative SOS response-associated peptidase YedK
MSLVISGTSSCIPARPISYHTSSTELRMCGRYALALEPDNLVAQVQNRLRRNDRPRRNARREEDSEEPQEDSEEQEEEQGQSGGGTSEEARTEDGEVLQGWIGKDDYRPWYNVAPQNRSPVLLIRKDGDEGKSGYWLRQMVRPSFQA